MKTIDEIVAMVRPDYVGVNNPRRKGVPTPGTAKVKSFEVTYDRADGTMLYVTIAED